MTPRPDTAPPRLYVAALPGEDIDPAALAATSAASGLPVAGLLTPAGAQIPSPLADQVFDHRQLPGVPDNPDPGAYWDAVAAAFAGEPGALWVVHAGTRVPRGAWRRLLLPNPEPGTIVFPLSVGNALSSAFTSIEHAPGLDAEQIDRWLNQYAPGLLADLPLPGGFSGLLYPAPGDEPLTFLLSDAAYVDDSLAPRQDLPGDACAAYREAFAVRHPLTGLRHALTQLSGRGEMPTAEVPATLPVNLHISHGWGGGLARWIEDFASADSHARSLILKPIGDRSAYGQTIALVDAAWPEIVLRSRTLTTPIISTATSHREYAQFLRSIIDEYRVSSLFVSSLIGHSMDLLRLDLPTIVVFHDFFPVCPAVIATFETPCESCDGPRLEQCLQHNPLQQFFRVEGPQHWHRTRRVFSELIGAGHLRLVAPSLSVERRLRLLGEGWPAVSWHIVPHGLPRTTAAPLEACRQLPPPDRERPLVAVLGSAEAHKGGAMLEGLCRELAERCDFLLLGFGDALDDLPSMSHVHAIGRYARGELGEIFAKHQPDLGLLLSTVPETFSFTLSELHAAAIPVLATRVGAFADRIEHGVDGWLVTPELAAIAQQLEQLCREPGQLRGAREALLARPVRDAAQMVEDYYALLPAAASFALARPSGPVALREVIRERSLLVDPEVRYATALGDFLAYTRRKVVNSPRVPGVLRRLARRLAR